MCLKGVTALACLCEMVDGMEAPGGVEPPTNGLGNRCSIQLSYGAIVLRLRNFTLQLYAQDMLSVRENINVPNCH